MGRLEIGMTGSPHCRPPAEDDLDDRVCTCSPEPYWVEWLEEQERKEKEEAERLKKEAEERERDGKAAE